ncbi:MAG: HAMP domain-containing protein [Spirochaetes bacterium]|nr:HAMP domain-containing protein [Spirochaetota bacterium]
MKLSNKILIVIIFSFFLITILFSIFIFFHQKSKEENSIKKAEIFLNVMIERERFSFANEIFEHQIKAIHLRLINITNLEFILSAAVYDNDGKLILSEGKYKQKENLNKDQMNFNVVNSYKVIKEIWNKIPLLSYIQPIYVIGEKFGYIKVDYSLFDLKKEIQNEYLIFFSLLTVTFIIMILLINFLLSLTILKPISTLADMMKKIQDEGPGIQITKTTNDEIGDLVKRFNTMSMVLFSSKNKIDKQQKQLKKSLSEKEILLKEINHRVKNNLNLIISLLEIHEEKILKKLNKKNLNKNNIVYELKKVQNKIYSIALIHKLLYKSEDISHINFANYIEELISQLNLSYNLKERNIKISSYIENHNLNIDTIKTCGIIINELIINSLEHAFITDKKNNIINVKFFIKDNNYWLIVSDNGKGAKSFNDIDNMEISGLNLIQLLSKELNGNVKILSGNGLKVQIIFPINNKRNQ